MMRNAEEEEEEERSSYRVSRAFAFLTACTKKIIYTMYKTCRFLIRCLFCSVFYILCFMHFINHDVM